MKLRDTLSATLLSHADAPRRWNSPLSPDPAKPYPLWLLAVRTLLWAVILGAASIGFLKILTGKWTLFLWVFWWAISAGAVCGGLTVLAWNRRAAKLQGAAQSGQPAPVPERLPKWCRFSLAPLYYLLFLILTPLLLALTVANQITGRQWAAYRSELVSRGVVFDVRSMMPKDVPATNNFASTPFFKDCPFTRESNRGPNHPFWERVNKVTLRGTAETRQPFALLWLSQQPLDLAKFRNSMTNASVFPQSGERTDDAAAVLAALAAWDADLRELTAAAARPVSVFSVRYEDNFNALLPHLSVLKDLGGVFRLRASARLRSPDTAGALQDLETSWRLANVSESEPLLISFLVGIAIDNQTRQVLWEGLKAKAWNESQLAEVDGLLATRDYAKLGRRAVDGERAISSTMMEQWIGDPAKQFREATQIGGLGNRGPVGNAEVFGLVFRALPFRFVISQNLITLNRWYDEILPSSGVPTDANAVQTKMDRLVAESSHPSEALVRLLFPAIGNFFERSTTAQTHQSLARTAIALERHHLANGSYPDTLAALTPKFLPTALNDPFSKAPLHYSKTTDGRYLLHSVGSNGRDDQGRFDRKAKPIEAFTFRAKEPKAAHPAEDDIAWTYLPLEK